MFYIASFWTGVFRTATFSVPYILMNQVIAEKVIGAKACVCVYAGWLVTERAGIGSSSYAISLIAVMLPCGFLLMTAVMGPLIEVTGDPGTSLYYCGVCSLCAAITARFLNI
ncbi:hypothetical protein PoB_004764800 [Plakobranchus ocellatus]|uniref:Uncharacterized protein n=1 Tax=Plakobranchus ocellatus TaxID=259542 RepID=A0AAV4BNI8_9GAST|nr:hypothetical protein PoB_004764800 [Plakobranchus ocellatus]